MLPAVLVNGRNMHYGYERGTAPRNPNYPVIQHEVRRLNGKAQSYNYTAQTPIQPWMLSAKTKVVLHQDSCGCGVVLDSRTGASVDLNLNPAPRMRLVQVTPPVTAQPVEIHEGKARVQFEVDKTVLHVEPYRTKRGNQLIDNRAQLAIIDDSVKYALSNPNVEIDQIEVTGYASPESPYSHNDFLASNRSKALADYLGQRYHLPKGASKYSAVPENWDEFRDQVENAKDITETQRADLLALIDQPAISPADYDAKEKTLKTDPRFAKLYASKILPEWFPHLRATKFAISTRLKPMPDEKLAEIIKTNPNYKLVEMKEADRCCGCGGSFNLFHYDLSRVIGQRKRDNVVATGAHVVAAGCPACMMQLEDVLSHNNDPVQVKHTIQIYAETLK